jgi:hypothetical protein
MRRTCLRMDLSNHEAAAEQGGRPDAGESAVALRGQVRGRRRSPPALAAKEQKDYAVKTNNGNSRLRINHVAATPLRR